MSRLEAFFDLLMLAPKSISAIFFVGVAAGVLAAFYGTTQCATLTRTMWNAHRRLTIRGEQTQCIVLIRSEPSGQISYQLGASQTLIEPEIFESMLLECLQEIKSPKNKERMNNGSS